MFPISRAATPSTSLLVIPSNSKLLEESITSHGDSIVTIFFGCKPKIQPFLVVNNKNNRKRLLYSFLFRNFAPEVTKKLRNMKIKAIITGDIVRSEQIALDKRDLLIKVLRDIVANLQKISPMKMEMFRGDSFQIVVECPETSLKIASMIRAGLKSCSPTDAKEVWDARISIGIGTTDYQGDSIVTSDGEAFKLSGRGLDAMEKNRLAVSTCWHDVNEELDAGLAFADDLITGWSVNQAKVIYLSVAQELSQTVIANIIEKSQQNVSKTLTSAKESLLVRFLKRFETIIIKHKEL